MRFQVSAASLGCAAPPTMVVPTTAFIQSNPASFAPLTQILKLQCQDGNQLFGSSNDCSTAGSSWKPLSFDGDPAKVGRQSEKTRAAFVSASFGHPFFHLSPS
jgi:hypothetical protein